MAQPNDIIWICQRCKSQYRQCVGGTAPPKRCICGGS
jgi:hypothetical protein